MLSKLSLGIAEARVLVDAASADPVAQKFPVSIAVVDASTYMQLVLRMDGAPLMSAQGALDKAQSAAEGGHPTTFFEKPLNEGRFSMLKLPHTPIEGGVPVFVDGQCAGAIGIAGAPPHIDAEIAERAIAALLATLKENA